MMRMINDCLNIDEAARAALEEFDRRQGARGEMVTARTEHREQSDTFGNRKERRRQAALERQGKA